MTLQEATNKLAALAADPGNPNAPAAARALAALHAPVGASSPRAKPRATGPMTESELRAELERQAERLRKLEGATPSTPAPSNPLAAAELAAQRAEMDRRMGLNSMDLGTRRVGNVVQFGVSLGRS